MLKRIPRVNMCGATTCHPFRSSFRRTLTAIEVRTNPPKSRYVAYVSPVNTPKASTISALHIPPPRILHILWYIARLEGCMSYVAMCQHALSTSTLTRKPRFCQHVAKQYYCEPAYDPKNCLLRSALERPTFQFYNYKSLASLKNISELTTMYVQCCYLQVIPPKLLHTMLVITLYTSSLNSCEFVCRSFRYLRNAMQA